MFTTLIMPLFGVIFIIGLAYYGTGWLAKKYSAAGSGKNMRVIERLNLGQDKSLMLVRAGGKTMLLGLTAKGFEVLRELEQSELTDDSAAPVIKKDFSSILENALKTNPVAEKLRKICGGKEDKQ